MTTALAATAGALTVMRGCRPFTIAVPVPEHACGIGAPIVSVERLARGDEIVVALRALEEHARRSVTHLIPGEIGGSNALRPMAGAALTGLPVIDGDGMGRAFPELQMDTFSIAGLANAPAAIAILCGFGSGKPAAG